MKKGFSLSVLIDIVDSEKEKAYKKAETFRRTI